MNRKTFARRMTGGILLLVSGLIAFAWFVWLAPLRHLSDITWLQSHKPKQVWRELQKEMACHAGYSHMSGSFLELWGDKESAAWLISQFKTGKDLMDCADGHMGAAIPFITNQELGWDTNAWITWWNANGDKTQEEWIRDGFAKRGLVLSRSLSTNDIVSLLKILDRKTTNLVTAVGTNKITGSLRYNAFRWLRDAGVIPIKFNFEALSPDDRNPVIRGMIIYSADLGSFADHPGRIFSADSDQTGYQPWFTNWKTELGVIIGILLLAWCGLHLFLRREAKLEGFK